MERIRIGKLHLAALVSGLALWSCLGCTFDLSLSQIYSSNLTGPNLPIALSPGDFPIGKTDFYLKDLGFYQPTVGGNFVVQDATDPACSLRTVDANFQLVSCFDAGSVNFLFVDATGNIYVTDSVLDEVRKFDKDGNLLLTLGGHGSGNGLFDLVSGVAVSGAGDIYAVDRINNRVQKFDSSGAFILSFGSAGTGDGQFSSPQAVAINPDGDILVADANNKRIQKFSPLGVFISKFGSAAAPDGALLLPIGLAVDSGSGDVYVADFFQNVILKYDSAGVLQWKTVPGQIVSTARVTMIAGEVVIPDLNRIVYYSTAGAFLREKKPQGTPLQATIGIAFNNSNHHFYVGNETEIKELNYQGQLVRTFGSFINVGGIALDKDGNIFATDVGTGQLLKFNSAGVLLGSFSSSGTGPDQLYNPYGLMIHDDIVYVCDTNNLRIQKFSTSGAHLGSFGDASGPGYMVGPTGIAIGTDDHLYISAMSGPVFKYDLNGTFVTTLGTFNVDSSVTDFSQGIAIHADLDGYIYVADRTENRITKFDTSGNYIATIGGYGGLPGYLHAPMGITSDAFGNFYVLEYENHRLQKFNINGVVQTQ